MTRRPAATARRRRRGVTLLEVIAALAIFLIAAAVVGQMVGDSSRMALRAKLLARAAVLAEAKMAEIEAGAAPLTGSAPAAAGDGDPGWTVAVNVQAEGWTGVTLADDGSAVTGLWLVQVTAAFAPVASGGGNEVEHTLSRVVLDPTIRRPPATQ
jgi:prepilin-type N-terminal cleavage/methylation domain-containing protein